MNTMWIEYASLKTNSRIKQFATQKHVYEVKQTVFEKPADSFKPALFALQDRFKITQNPCQTVLNFFGFLFTPGLPYPNLKEKRLSN